MGEGRRRCRRATRDERAEGYIRGIFTSQLARGWCEEWGEAVTVHMPTSFTYVTEEHFFFVKGTVTYSALARGILGEGVAMAIGERWYGPGRERLRLGV